MTARPHPDALAAYVRQRPEAFTRASLVAMFSRASLDRALASGTVVRLAPRTYGASENEFSFHTRAHAAMLWGGPGVALGGVAALFAWGLVDTPPERIEVVAAQAQRPRPPEWMAVRRVTVPVPIRDRGPVRVVAPAHAIVQGLAQVPRSESGDIVYRAVRERLASPSQLAAALRDTPRVTERRRLERLVRLASAGVHSPLEERAAWRVFTGARLGELLRQHQVVVEAERFYLDTYDATTRTAFEVDGDKHHSSPADRVRDVRRDAVLATVGILTVRFASADVRERPEWCRRVALDVLAAREGQRAGRWRGAS